MRILREWFAGTGHMRGTLICLALIVGLLWAGGAAQAAGEFQVIEDPANALSFYVVQGRKQAVMVGFGAWGPQWSAANVKGNADTSKDVLEVTGTAAFGGQERAVVHMGVSTAGPQRVRFDYTVTTTKAIPLTMLGPVISAPSGHNVQAVLWADGKAGQTVKLPATAAADQKATKFVLGGDNWTGAIEAAMDRETAVGVNEGLRVQMASGELKAGATSMTVTLTFPTDMSLKYKPADMEKLAPVVPTADWFPWTPTWDTGKSVIGMEDWLDKPAGIHGGVRMVGDHFEFTDGTPVKFWGVNLAYSLSAPTKANADFTAARFAKYGVNAVRMHKFTGTGWQGIGDPNDATKFTADGLNRLDYFLSKLAEKGIYYGWSHTYRFTVRPGNKDQLAGYDELMKKGGDTYGLINWAEDVQDLMIEQVVNLLHHKNPYTGKTYAEDPALCFIELQNEDDIFFYTSAPAYDNFPTYRKLLQKRFGQWLTAKYGTPEKLIGAWRSALKSDESMERGTVALQMNPWFMSDQHLPALKDGERQRMLDNTAFLFDTQTRFYDKFVKAIRGAGYAGPILGSAWQAPTMVPHYYNLRADDEAGYIDRHTYFGGQVNDTMLRSPGSGLLAAGFDQVSGKPFAVSEWNVGYPSLYSAEGPVIMAAYGMGLQGWNAAYEFQSTSDHPQPGAKALVGQLPWGTLNADVPTQMGQYPVLSRMILRGDIKEGPVISIRRIAPDNLRTGTFDFSTSSVGSAERADAVLPETLAAGRAPVEFVDRPMGSTFPDITRYKQGQVITSATGQLTWDASGVITIDTAGTQGVVGFANGREFKLKDVGITSKCPYASILVTAEDRGATIRSAKRVLVSAVARNSNTGFRFLDIDGSPIVENGSGPIMLEPVEATVAFPGRQLTYVHILNDDGRSTSQAVPIQGENFMIDGKMDHAVNYEVGLE